MLHGLGEPAGFEQQDVLFASSMLRPEAFVLQIWQMQARFQEKENLKYQTSVGSTT